MQNISGQQIRNLDFFIIHILVNEWTMQWTFNHFILFFISENSHLCKSLRIIYFIHLHMILKIEFLEFVALLLLHALQLQKFRF